MHPIASILIHESVGNRRLGMPIRYTYNAAFATTGSVASLLAGAKNAPADVVRARDEVFPRLRATAPAIFGPRTAMKIHSGGG